MGQVIFVGAGTGDPRLLTLRGAQALASADFVIFDRDTHPETLGRLREGTERHPVTPGMTADVIAHLLVDRARAGKCAVRIAHDDPMFFGTADAEAMLVHHLGAPIELVPGIGPLVAIGAFAGIPLTRSSDASPSVAAVSVTRGHESLHDWDKLATATDTLAIVCDAESVPETARSLVFYGRTGDERVTIIEAVSRPNQRVVETTLAALPLLPRAFTERVVLVVGGRPRQNELAWFEKMPLFGKRVLVTRARGQADSAASILRERGADPLVVPTIEIHPPGDPGPMIDAVSGLDRYGWVVFTSANGVLRTWAEIRRQGKDARAFASSKIAVIGPGTAAALAGIGLVADLVAKDSKGEGLAAELRAALGNAKPRILLARAEIARDVVPDALRALGCTVDVVAVYQTKAPPRPLLEALTMLLEQGHIDAVTFTSSSTVEHLCDALGDRAGALLANTVVASIGPITTATAEKRGVRVDVTSGEHTMPGLVAGLETHFAP